MGWGTPLERFEAKVRHVDSGCWQWVGGKKAAGYGQFSVDGHKVIAHRWAYLHFVGTIPSGYEVDHLCGNESCVNPAHLEAVTVQENRRRRVAAKTHCPKDHAYDEANTYYYIDDNGHRCRHCRACQRDTANRRYQGKRQPT